MDLSAYPHLAELGLIKEMKLNRKICEELYRNLDRISDEEFRKIDEELPNAVKLHNVIITPTAIIKVSGLKKVKPISNIILTKDLIYVWGATTTMRMYFIPYQKMHVVNMLARTGSSISTDTVSTAAFFSKKNPTGDFIDALRRTIDLDNPGILYGWSKEREKAMSTDINLLINAVDEARGQA